MKAGDNPILATNYKSNNKKGRKTERKYPAYLNWDKQQKEKRMASVELCFSKHRHDDSNYHLETNYKGLYIKEICLNQYIMLSNKWLFLSSLVKTKEFHTSDCYGYLDNQSNVTNICPYGKYVFHKSSSSASQGAGCSTTAPLRMQIAEPGSLAKYRCQTHKHFFK